jgi:hypothetical protein
MTGTTTAFRNTVAVGITSVGDKGGRVVLHKEFVNVIVGNTAVSASTARKGRHSTAGIDNDCLSLRR